MIQKKSILILIISIFSLSLHAQYKTTKIKMAEGLFEEGKYFASLKIYLDIVNNQGNNLDIHFKLAQINELLYNYAEAAKWYYELYEIQQGEYPKAEFKFAELIMMQGEYKLALEHFESFIKSYRGHDKLVYSRLCKGYIESCKSSVNNLPREEFSVKKIKGINSVYTDLAPFAHNGQLYFSSIPSDSSIEYKGYNDSIPNFQIYKAEQIKDEKFDTASLFIPEIINKSYEHTSNGSFSPDGTMFFFTRCKKNINDKNICKIYYCLKNDSSWNAPILLGNEVNSNNNDFSSTHPTVMISEKKAKKITTEIKLLFASNMPGGQGGYDLWMTSIDTSLKVSKPENLGKRINTDQNELTPSYDSYDKKLFFSSNGHGGFGGLDTYESSFKNGKLKKIKHLEKPINTSWDDWYYSQINSNNAFIVSNRRGAQAYQSEIRLDDIFFIKKEKKKYLKLYAFDNKNSLPLKEAIFYVKFANDKYSRGKNIRFGESFQIVPNKTYEIIAQKNKYFNQSTLFSTSSDTKSDSLKLDFKLKKLQLNRGTVLNSIYFENNSTELKPESKQSLNKLVKLLLDNPSLRIEIGGHTDNQGSREYNLNLSKNRAEKVVNYLIKKGIGKDILRAKGYGNSNPISTKNNSPLNRRIEYKVTNLYMLDIKDEEIGNPNK